MHEFMLLYPKIPINLSYLIICHAAEPHNYRHQLCARITTVKNSQIQKKYRETLQLKKISRNNSLILESIMAGLLLNTRRD